MKQESNYQIIDPSYGPEEDKEGGMWIHKKVIETDRMTMMKEEIKWTNKQKWRKSKRLRTLRRK